MGKGVIKTTINKRIEQEYSEDEVEEILIEHFKSKLKLSQDAQISVNFDINRSGGYLRSATVYFEDRVVEEKPE